MTPRRRHILQLVHDAIETTGVAPSLVELGAMTSTTHGAVCRHVQALESTGYLRRTSEHRSMQVMRMPGRGLMASEITWCHANPERVRAMMRLTGAATGS